MARRRGDYGIEAGRLRDRVTFQLKTWVTVNGQDSFSWGNDFILPAEAIRLSEQAARFTIRHAAIRPDTHRILFWDAIWTITNAVPDQRSTILTIDSDFSGLVEVTHMQSRTREHIEEIPIVRPPQ